ncbi:MULTISPECIES: cysteine desulfurase family protein [unclassified Frigoribacterium]|jgi:cysteine desulfurase|uniref:cysteine desulfurase family protein n=1 Tax=unclassified Frigoribacterium TaxID=2627005 RepID=UPI0005B98839|nr:MULTISPECIES: cysteine desulfurase family protein [unclassified Frigoribacterium]KIU03775.1 cysteine desulfurase [Frigoribacterium sp. MEB024]KQN45587.1 cysteine desulfurase [Frigoribacterium sp. Leaf44]MBD8538897.1 cysteine desulfurase [Frigoribacterium sp. CFBP 8751]
MSVYLDHAATTPMHPAAIAAYAEALGTVGNPSSIHSAGQNAKRVLEEARERVAATLGCDPIEVVFTSGGTEAVNLAIKGLWWARQSDRPRPRLLVPAGEHHATVDTVEWLERYEGAVVTWLPLDEQGRLRVDALAAALDEHDDVALVSLLWANNEVGTMQPVDEVVALAAAHGVPVHSDAVAAYGQVPIDFAASGLAALSVSAHKIGGPIGIGALVLSRSATVVPLIHGGGQQRQVRSGTQDAPAAVAFAVAAEQPHGAYEPLRDRLIAGVLASVPGAVLRGDPVDRLPGNAHFTFDGCEGDSLLFLLDAAGVSVSTGSACQAGIPEPSHVLLGMGLPADAARGALRMTIGHTSTDADVDALLAALPTAVARATTAGYADRAPVLGAR